MGIKIKTPEEIKIMAEGGAKLGRVKKGLAEAVKPGVSAWDIEILANELIKKEGAESSFKKVPGYSWSTCISVNEGLVHGIPHKTIIFQNGDLVSVDVGVYFRGFHTDTSISIGINLNSEDQKFFNVGKATLEKAIAKARPGNHIYDISKVMEDELKKHGYSPIKALVGHGVGRDLHEDPQIPCFVPGRIEDSPTIKPGMVVAIEVMYALGSDKVEVTEDGWTIRMRDGKISGLFEDSVAITEKGSKVLTK